MSAPLTACADPLARSCHCSSLVPTHTRWPGRSNDRSHWGRGITGWPETTFLLNLRSGSPRHACSPETHTPRRYWQT